MFRLCYSLINVTLLLIFITPPSKGYLEEIFATRSLNFFPFMFFFVYDGNQVLLYIVKIQRFYIIQLGA